MAGSFEITDTMIAAGAAALYDGSDIENFLSPTMALVVSQNVLEAAFRQFCDERPQLTSATQRSFRDKREGETA